MSQAHIQIFNLNKFKLDQFYYSMSAILDFDLNIDKVVLQVSDYNL